MVYAWKSNSRIKAKPEEAAEVFSELERSGGLTPKRLVDASKPKNAPLHDEFEWNDKKAAEQFRESQAAHMIRCLVILEDEQEGEAAQAVRAYFPVTEPQEYTHITRILSRDDFREKMLNRALEELVSFQKKYESLSELKPVFDSIKTIAKRTEAMTYDTV